MMIHKHFLRPINFLLVCLLFSCNTPVQTANPARTPIITALPQSVTELVNKGTPTAFEPTEISSPEVRNIEYNCLKIRSDTLQTSNIDGVLILRNPINLVEDNLLFLNIGSGKQKYINNNPANLYSLSPKGTFLAFDAPHTEPEQDGHQIHILDSGGNTVVEVNAEENWSGFNWLDEDNLLINVPAGNDPLILVAPFTGKQRNIEPFATETQRPLSQELIYAWGFYAYHKIVYNDDLTRAVYAILENGEPKIVIRDTISKKDLALYPSYEAWGVSPKWSPNGKKFAIALNTNSRFKVDNVEKYELFIIDQDGNKLFSTNLSSSFQSLYISSFSWSPDSNYIAFWYTTENDIHQNLELAMLDVNTKRITNYCLTKNEETHSWKRNDISPIWSPNSADLLVEIPDISDQTPNSVIVDIFQEKAVLVKSGLIPVGWMISP